MCSKKVSINLSVRAVDAVTVAAGISHLEKAAAVSG